MAHTAALPKATTTDRRSVAQRTPQIPATVWARVAGEATEEKVHVLVGTGGYAQDADHAAARALDVDVTEITVVAVQGGHR